MLQSNEVNQERLCFLFELADCIWKPQLRTLLIKLPQLTSVSLDDFCDNDTLVILRQGCTLGSLAISPSASSSERRGVLGAAGAAAGPRHPPRGGPRLLLQLHPDGQDPAEPEPRAGAGDAARDVGTLQVDGSIAQIHSKGQTSDPDSPSERSPSNLVSTITKTQLSLIQMSIINYGSSHLKAN